MKKKQHIILSIEEGSLAEQHGIVEGDILISINGEDIKDIFDYQYLIQDEKLILVIEKVNGDKIEYIINKDYSQDLGIVFENSFMDDYRSCHNKCIFCFIDQMPKGMRETLYFKDDDSRLSFLQGNYITLTNMSDYDLDRIIKYHLSPINISFQTTNPELRCMMLNNRFAGDALKKVDLLFEANIEMNGQIVLCKGVNDKEELERSISDLTKYIPNLKSVSVVPVGLSKYREGLYPLEPFTQNDAKEVVQTIERWQKQLFEEYGTHFIHASDEWYLLAGEKLPLEEQYDGYLQLENGVGMLRVLTDEFRDAFLAYQRKHFVKTIKYIANKKMSGFHRIKKKEIISIATGRLAYPYIKKMAIKLEEYNPSIEIHVYAIRNDFFGERITVSGLLTAQDIMKQLTGKIIGERLLLPQNVLRSGEQVFLDDITVEEVEKTLQVKVDIVKSSGQDFVNTIYHCK